MSKYKVLGFMSLHYSGDYFREALLAVRDKVEKFHIAFSIHPSQGHGTDMPNPDKEEDMRRVAEEVLGDKLIWDTYPTFDFEGKHRNERYRYAQGMDCIWTVDADEVFHPDDVDAAIEDCMNGRERFCGVTGFVHLYRSFRWGMTDHWNPMRFENNHANNTEQRIGIKCRVYHFSYAQRREILQYKFKVSGHLDELRKNYLADTWENWSPEKVDEVLHLHPSSFDVWGKAYPVNADEMPLFMRDHKNWGKHLIE